MTDATKNILIRGWRFLPHSYAVVNQFQCLEMARRTDLTIYFEDVPFYGAQWERRSGLFSADDEQLIEQIQPLPAGIVPDAELRIAFPYDLSSPAKAERCAVFGTAEYKAVPTNYFSGKLNDAAFELITPSKWSREGFIRSGADAARTSVVPHGVDPELFRPPTAAERDIARAEQGLRDDEFVFLTVGAMTGNKNPEMVISAFASVLRSHPGAILILKGMDDLYGSYQMFKFALAAALPGIEMATVLPRIRYVGKSLSFAEMASLYHSADCYVTPYSAEAFNLPALEAAACGLPLICTAGGPTDEFTDETFVRRINSAEFVQDNNGERMTSLTPDAGHLQELMTGIVGDETFRKHATEKGPAYVLGNFTWKHAVDKLLAVLLDQPGSDLAK